MEGRSSQGGQDYHRPWPRLIKRELVYNLSICSVGNVRLLAWVCAGKLHNGSLEIQA